MDSQLLARRITSDWLEYRERLTTPNRLKTYLRLERIHMYRLQESIQTFGHVLDYERRSYTHIYGFLSKLIRTTPTQNEFLSEESNIRVVLYGLGLQHAFATGHLRSKPEETAEAESPVTLQQIMADIQGRIQADPETAKIPSIKSIVFEFQAYKKEQTSFRELSPKISDERAPAFFTAYKQRVEQITQAIRNKYANLLSEETSDSRKARQASAEKELVNEALAKVLSAQAQEISRVRSTLILAVQEGRGFREDMLKLGERRDITLSLVEEQENILEKMSGGTDPARFQRRLTSNLVAILQELEKTD